MGDNIYQGRFGNSIRLGSTNIPSNTSLIPLNSWSSIGNTGDPITILRNGQPTDDTNLPSNPWDAIDEQINNDLSSIYMTSTQQLPISVASKRYFSYPSDGTPISPSQYKDSQVIINSGRLLFNSKSDHILLSSQKTISFEAVKGFNFDTPGNFIIDIGTHIKLGSKNAIESVIKGDTLYKHLNNLVEGLIQVVEQLKYAQKWPGGNPAPDTQMSLAASSTEGMLKDIQKDLKDILSKKVKTI